MSVHVGGHATLSKAHLDDVRRFYRDASHAIQYTVAMVDRSPSLGHTRVYLDDPRDGSRLCVYWRHVRGVPRCAYCDQEGHTKSKATRKNCSVIAEEQKEKRARREDERAAAKASKPRRSRKAAESVNP